MICHESLDLWISRHRFTRPSQVPEVQTLQTSQHCTLMIDCKNCHLTLFGLTDAVVFCLVLVLLFLYMWPKDTFFLRQIKEERTNKAFKKLLDRLSWGTDTGMRKLMLLSCLDTDLKINRTDH